jgi:DNA-binding transcriptional MerR regulator
MQKTFKYEDIDQIMAEADDLLQQINSEIIKDIEERRRAQLEEHAQRLKKLRSEVQDKIDKEGTPEGGSFSEGMHEAIEDIVKATKALASYLS